MLINKHNQALNRKLRSCAPVSTALYVNMNYPEPEIRYPTKEAIDSLAFRFSLPNHDGMQDWEWEVADYKRIGEFLEAYREESTSEDEKFVLLEMLLQSFEDSPIKLSNSKEWNELLRLSNQRFSIHSYTIWYWSCFESEKPEHIWRISQFMRGIYAKNV